VLRPNKRLGCIDSPDWARFPIALALVAALLGCRPGASNGDAGPIPVACSPDAAAAGRTNGSACGCDRDCGSGFCVDGVCCDSACTGTCQSCRTKSAPGTCSFVAAGDAPRTAADCPRSDPATCGLDGTCDGQGACRSHVLGTVCQAGTCEGASVTNSRICDGAGSCEPGPATICAPFNCDPKTSACRASCASDADCIAGVSCVNGSCGKKPMGAACAANAQCVSGFCADGFCCNVACTGPCVSCNQGGRVGACWPIPAGIADPHSVCRATDRSTCGQTGACDGLGGCAKYAADTVCTAPSCSGTTLTTAGTCDGLGTCRAPGQQSCAPYQCTRGACVGRCTSDADCAAGHACVNGSCGPKGLGQSCSTGTDCASGFCADGVCCDSACGGSCRSCALPASVGTCTPVASGSRDPHGACVDQHAPSCGTDGTCDGLGGCHKYPAGTACAAESCSGGAYTGGSACDGQGACRAPAAISCAPYACNGSRCFQSCSNDKSCSAGNVCVQGSCGLKPNGAGCSAGGECQSGQCAQGVCCATACGGACMSCALAGTLGACTPVPSGMPDPAGLCTDQGSASCGNNGKCQAGACQKYPKGTACGGASCPAGGSSFTAAGSCDGAGACATPKPSSCAPYTCGASACKASCATSADCVSGYSCVAGACSNLKPNGAACAAGPECASGMCTDGVCCASGPCGACAACNLAGKAGSCAPLPAGTVCAAAACRGGKSSMLVAASACDGAGTCVAGAATDCAPQACTNDACTVGCTSDMDCAPGSKCKMAGKPDKMGMGPDAAAGTCQ
jgi:hypothetical protein